MQFRLWSIPMMLLLMSAGSSSRDVLSDIAQAKMDSLVALLTAIQSGFIHIAMNNCNDIQKILGISSTKVAASGQLDLTTITLHLYSGSQNATFYFTSNVTTAILSSSLWDNTKPVVLFTPGFLATTNSPISRNMATRLASLGLYNVLIVDPSSVLGWFYYYSAMAVSFIGNALGKVLAGFYNAGITKFHVIGHSLGAHISGFAGKTFKNITGVMLDRISGLDPAGPCFFDEGPSLRLNSTDATFVDVIHSDAGTFGIPGPCGHIDFYPNGGNNQPDCLGFMCSHNKSWEFFSESLLLTTNFPSVNCSDWYTFKTGACAANPQVLMGYATPVGSRGIYYLKTAATSLYGLGENGIITPATVDSVTGLIMWWKSLFTIFG